MDRKPKRIARNPERFETMDLYQAFVNRQALKFSDQAAEQGFIRTLSNEINRSKADPIVIHGRRIESMFGYVAASLGKCLAIKKEDAGDIYAVDTGMKPPDYRIVLDSGYECLVEVKNHRPGDPTAPYRFRKSDLEDLLEYAKVFNKDLKIAVYWSRWNIWTLIAGEEIDANNEKPSIGLPLAAKLNEMSLLGDQSIATVSPLVLRLKPDSQKPVAVDDTHLAFNIGAVELYCGGTLVEEASEKNLALYLMLFGRWPASNPQPRIRDDILEAVDIVATPETPTPNQPFEFVGDLSGMISRHYNFLTTSETGIERLEPTQEPGALGVGMPSTCDYLKLWRFTIRRTP